MIFGSIVACLVLSTAPTARAIRSLRDVSETQLDDQQFWDADQQYWATQFVQLQKEMFQLQRAAGESVTADLQLTSQPSSNQSVASPAAQSVPTKPHNVSAMGHAAEAFETAASGLAGLPSMPDAKAMQGKIMLEPMLAMLKGMYEDQKHRIAELNRKEEEGKKRFAKQKADYEARVAKVKNNTLLSPGTAKNATEQATKFFKYWERSRDRGHRQFHNALKITHSAMAKEKEMIAAYEKAINGVKPTVKEQTKLKEMKQSLPEQAPEVVLAQQRKLVTAFCQETLKEIDVELRQQKEMDPELN